MNLEDMRSKKLSHAILKFDEDILKILGMCEVLQKQLNDIRSETSAAGNPFSERLLLNQEYSPFIDSYIAMAEAFDKAFRDLAHI